MSFGLGIGSFVQGLRSGMEAREAADDRRERRLDRQEARDARAQERANTEELAAIGRQANDEIAAGGNREEVEARYWRQIQDGYARQGQPEKARQFQQWVQSDEARRGIAHFQNGMVMFEMARKPDGSYDPQLMARGLQQLERAQAITAYGGDRQFRFRPIVEGEGENERTIGYRMQFQGEDGKTIERDVAPGDIPRAAAMFFNPQAAFEDRRKQDEARAKQQETQRSTERSEWQAAEEQVRKEYEERRTDVTRRDTTPMRPWADLDQGERDQLVQNRAQSRVPPTQRSASPGLAGAGAAPRARVAFDNVTGQAAGPPAGPSAQDVATREAAYGGSPRPAPRPIAPSVPAPAPGPGSTAASPVAEAMRPGPVTREEEQRDAIRAGAERAIAAGESPDNVARGLERAGIPVDAWPESLRAGIMRRQQISPPNARAPGLQIYGAPR
ncbi:hypothetical protein [Phreatobacter oligotrophus]|uniref:Uncharacterized protein n=1 Tax=Phreatobacter oligotrophus TaxID=1122261 RepID=A0A2T4ZIV5_9HYPH|nr:hypothetical protein [Phreatobacter oligotrophus]PTM61913.1 hypothetical protein C8P69_101586 [Phreatobacter oligotrophus]